MADYCDHVPEKNRRDSGNYRLETLTVLKLAGHYEQPENEGLGESHDSPRQQAQALTRSRWPGRRWPAGSPSRGHGATVSLMAQRALSALPESKSLAGLPVGRSLHESSCVTPSQRDSVNSGSVDT
jgi:hypothetical protein